MTVASVKHTAAIKTANCLQLPKFISVQHDIVWSGQ